MQADIQWPKKTREILNWAMDSTYWNDFVFRDDDVIIGTWQKAGTTWVQQIIAQFIFEGETEGLPIGDMSPWLDFRLPPLPEKLPGVEAQTHRRFLKTHLPLDALRFEPKVKYIYIARDGRDCAWSQYNHHFALNDLAYESLNALPEVGPRLPRPRPMISASITSTGSTATAPRSGHFGKTSVPGGRRAICPMSISCIFRTWSTIWKARCARSPIFWKFRWTRANGRRWSTNAPSTT